MHRHITHSPRDEDCASKFSHGQFTRAHREKISFMTQLRRIPSSGSASLYAHDNREKNLSVHIMCACTWVAAAAVSCARLCSFDPSAATPIFWKLTWVYVENGFSGRKKLLSARRARTARLVPLRGAFVCAVGMFNSAASWIAARRKDNSCLRPLLFNRRTRIVTMQPRHRVWFACQ